MTDDKHPSPPSSLESPTTSMDSDALFLASMGYTPALKRNYSVLSVLSIAFSLTNSWFAISVALITGINSGGPVLIIYGIILICIISIGVGISLSELASAMPNAGGQYFWVNELSSERWSRGLSYLTGWFAWAGAVFTSASVSLACASGVVGCYQLSHPDLYVLHLLLPLRSSLPPSLYVATPALWPLLLRSPKHQRSKASLR